MRGREVLLKEIINFDNIVNDESENNNSAFLLIIISIWKKRQERGGGTYVYLKVLEMDWMRVRVRVRVCGVLLMGVPLKVKSSLFYKLMLSLHITSHDMTLSYPKRSTHHLFRSIRVTFIPPRAVPT